MNTSPKILHNIEKALWGESLSILETHGNKIYIGRRNAIHIGLYSCGNGKWFSAHSSNGGNLWETWAYGRHITSPNPRNLPLIGVKYHRSPTSALKSILFSLEKIHGKAFWAVREHSS